MRREPVFTWETERQYEARLTGDPAFLAAQMRQAAVDGNVKAQLGLAHMLLEGHGADRDPDAAFRWFQLAARSGHPDAINMVGRCHELGWGTVLNTRMAAQCYRAAGEMGHAWANFNLAMLMLAGNGAEGETGEILSLLVRSARRGNAKAMNCIGQMCEDGWRGRANLAAARRWYARAARRSCFRGAFNTARHLMTDGDVDGAVYWLRRSVEVAPAGFCAELGAYLEQHPEVRLREIAALAGERARSAPPGPVSQTRPPEAPASSSPKAPPSALTRGRHSVRRMFRGLARATTPRGT